MAWVGHPRVGVRLVRRIWQCAAALAPAGHTCDGLWGGLRAERGCKAKVNETQKPELHKHKQETHTHTHRHSSLMMHSGAAALASLPSIYYWLGEHRDEEWTGFWELVATAQGPEPETNGICIEPPK